MEITGIENINFIGKDGTPVEGANIFGTASIAPDRGVGRSARKIFLSKAKLEALPFKPQPTLVVGILYNKYGKPQTLVLVSDADDTVEID